MKRRIFNSVIVLTTILNLSCTGKIILHNQFNNSIDWFTVGANFQRISNSAHTSLTPPLELFWTKRFTSGISGSPIVTGGLLLIPMLNGEVIMFRLEDEKRLGRKKFDNGPINGLTIYNGTLYLGLIESKKSFIAYDLRKGKIKWSKKIGPIEAAPVIKNGKVFIGSTNHYFYCLNSVSGKIIWKFRSSAAVRTSAALGNGIIIFIDQKGVVYALHSDSGKLIWKTNVGISFSYPVIFSNQIYISTFDGNVHVLNTKTGNQVWMISFGDPIYSSPTVDTQYVFIATSDGTIQSMKRENGETVWSLNIDTIINTEMILSGNNLITISQKGGLFMIDKNNGQIVWSDTLKYRNNSPPILYDNYLIVSDDHKTTYVYKESHVKNQ